MMFILYHTLLNLSSKKFSLRWNYLKKVDFLGFKEGKDKPPLLNIRLPSAFYNKRPRF
jgi:hypothetical protein